MDHALLWNHWYENKVLRPPEAGDRSGIQSHLEQQGVLGAFQSLSCKDLHLRSSSNADDSSSPESGLTNVAYSVDSPL